MSILSILNSSIIHNPSTSAANLFFRVFIQFQGNDIRGGSSGRSKKAEGRRRQIIA